MPASCLAVAYVAAVGGMACVQPLPEARPAVMPKPIQLSARDRVSPETRMQIEWANGHLRRLARQYELNYRIGLPAP